MIKKTLYFGNPAYLSLRDNQLVIKLPEVESNDTLPDGMKKDTVRTIPIEDIGVVVIDNQRKGIGRERITSDTGHPSSQQI